MIMVGGGAAGMIMQVYRDLAGCAINCTSHVEGWHKTLKVRFLCQVCLASHDHYLQAGVLEWA